MNRSFGPFRVSAAIAVVGLAQWAMPALSAALPPGLVLTPAVFASNEPLVDDLAVQEPAANLRRQMVIYVTDHAAGTVVIDTAHTYLYYVLGKGHAIRYGIGVGRDGFAWSGTESVTRKAEWPDWIPPSEMIARQPYLARWSAGGEGNPLGARALYLGNTIYRIHGTNMPETIGQRVSSGCIRMLNADIIDLYARVSIGTRIIVLPNSDNGIVAAIGAPVERNLNRSEIY